MISPFLSHLLSDDLNSFLTDLYQEYMPFRKDAYWKCMFHGKNKRLALLLVGCDSYRFLFYSFFKYKPHLILIDFLSSCFESINDLSQNRDFFENCTKTPMIFYPIHIKLGESLYKNYFI